MSQLPPSPGDFAAPTPADFAPSGLEKPPWSVAAIAGFVLSLLGCTLVGAVGGLVLGIVGITRTGGGKRRGRGLAIAAIPISLVTGLIGVFLGMSMVTLTRVAAQMERFKGALTIAATDSVEAADQLRGLCSDDFNDSVSDAQLQAWLGGVVAKHGRLVDIPLETLTRESAGAGDQAVLSLQGKFVNGQVSIAITVAQSGLMQMTIDDIAVDGVSPRGLEGD